MPTMIAKRLPKRQLFGPANMAGEGLKRLGGYLSRALPAQTRDSIRDQSKLLCLITSALPPAVGGQCRHAVIRGSELRITVETSSQASILRFHQPVLVEKLHSAGYPQVRIIRLQVSPKDVWESAVIRQRRLPGKNIVGVIATSATACQEPEIQAALIRLANTLEGLQDSTSATDPKP